MGLVITWSTPLREGDCADLGCACFLLGAFDKKKLGRQRLLFKKYHQVFTSQMKPRKCHACKLGTIKWVIIVFIQLIWLMLGKKNLFELYKIWPHSVELSTLNWIIFLDKTNKVYCIIKIIDFCLIISYPLDDRLLITTPQAWVGAQTRD